MTLKNSLYTLLVMFPVVVYSQNLITNGSFENCASTPASYNCNSLPGTPTCSNVPYYNSQFYWVANWNSLCTADWFYDASGYMDIPNNIPITTSEFCGTSQSIDAQDGSHYAGLYNEEAIYYDFGSNLSKGYYQITFWTNSCETDYKVRVYGSNNELEKDNDCDFKVSNGQKIYSLHQQTLTGGTWQKVTVNFNTFQKEVRFLTITGDKHGYGCTGADYFFVDDVYMESLGCCPEYQLYQNVGIASSVTERRNYIRAGEDVGASTATGPVYVVNNGNVIFRAGNYINLEPGFQTTTNSTFVAEIKPCENNTQSSGINVPFIPDGYTPNGDGINDQWCFYAFNAVYYRVLVMDRWDNEHYFEGYVPSDGHVCLADIDVDDLCESLYQLNGSGPVYDVLIHLIGCGEDYYSGDIAVVAYCPPPSGKTEFEASLVSKEVIVKPNPFDREVVISSLNAFDGYTKEKIVVRSVSGAVVYSDNVFPTNGNIYVNTGNLTQGMYLLSVTESGNWHHFKIIKQ